MCILGLDEREDKDARVTQWATNASPGLGETRYQERAADHWH